VVFAALIVVVAVVVIAVADPFGSDGGGASEVNDGGTRLTMVVRESLSSQTASSGTLGFADSYSVINQASGTVSHARVGTSKFLPSGAPRAWPAGCRSQPAAQSRPRQTCSHEAYGEARTAGLRVLLRIGESQERQSGRQARC
jgi:hypothetical protein